MRLIWLMLKPMCCPILNNPTALANASCELNKRYYLALASKSKNLKKKLQDFYLQAIGLGHNKPECFTM